MTTTRRLTAAALCAAALGAAACSDSNKPEAVDPAVVSSGMTGLTATFSSNLAFQSLRELSGAFTFTAAGAAVSATLPPAPGDRTPVTLTPVQRHALTQFALHGGSGALAIFPADVLGKMFVWDTVPNKYVKSLTATGAPSNGVRFELYLVNTATHQPQRPLIKVGYVDITDLSTAQANKLGILVKYGTQTIASYTITAVVSTSSIALSAAGYLTDGTARLDFDLSTAISQTGLTIDYALNGSNGFSATLHVTVNLVTGASTFVWTIANGGNSVEVNATATNAAVNGQIKFNGVVVATLTGDPANPTIAGAAGHTFTTQQLANLRAVFNGFGELLDQLDGIFAPGDLVF